MVDHFRQLNRPAQIFLVAICLLAVGSLVAVGRTYPVPDETALALYFALAVVAGSRKLALPSRLGTLSAGCAVVFAALLQLGPAGGLSVAIVSALAGSLISQRTRRVQPAHRIFFNIATLVLATFAAGLAFEWGGGTFNSLEWSQNLVSMVVAMAVYYLLDTWLVAIIMGLSEQQSIWSLWHKNFAWILPGYYASAGVAVLIHWLYHEYQWVGWAAGTLTLYVIHIAYRDHLERLRAEMEEAKRTADLLRSIFDSAGVGMTIIAQQGLRLQDINRQQRTFFPPEQELVGRTCQEVFAGFSDPGPLQAVQQTFATGELVTLENVRDGRGRIYRLVASPLQTGGERAVVLIMSDVTDLKEMEERMGRADKLRALGQMASGMAHNFNNSLTAILNAAELLRLRGSQESVRDKYLPIIIRATERASQTVRRIQDFARQRADQPFRRVQINQIVEDAVELAKMQWREEVQSMGTDIRVQLELGEVGPVRGHAGELQEVMMNLILNAVQAMPEGGDLSIRTASQDGQVHITVSDTGIGMSEEVRQRIFEPFFTTKEKGTGLGLSVSYSTIVRHQGEISVDSTLGQGTTFEIRLPLDQKPVAPSEVAWPKLETRLSALVVDDEADLREALVELLTEEGHLVYPCSTGQEVLDCCRNARYDFVFTDLGMPHMSGWEVARAVKQIDPQASVILVTGWGEEINPASLEQHGVDGVLSKPYTLTDIRRVMGQVWQSKSPRREPRPATG